MGFRYFKPVFLLLITDKYNSVLTGVPAARRVRVWDLGRVKPCLYSSFVGEAPCCTLAEVETRLAAGERLSCSDVRTWFSEEVTVRGQTMLQCNQCATYRSPFPVKLRRHLESTSRFSRGQGEWTMSRAAEVCDHEISHHPLTKSTHHQPVKSCWKNKTVTIGCS